MYVRQSRKTTNTNVDARLTILSTDTYPRSLNSIPQAIPNLYAEV